jgi:hypothetical protein
VKNIANDFRNVCKHFNLTHRDEILLAKFIVDQGKRIYTASLIMEEKRWREALPALKYISKIMDRDLKFWWVDYLNSYDVTDPIPKTPLHESVCFITYILDKATLIDVDRLVAEYEKNRNIAFSYDFNADEDQFELHDTGMVELAMDGYAAMLNPSFSIKFFNCRISKVIFALQRNEMSYMKDLSIDLENEHVAFYKNRITGAVCASNISEIGRLAISKLPDSRDLNELIFLISNARDIKQEKVMSLIKVMNKNDVISIHKFAGSNTKCNTPFLT